MKISVAISTLVAGSGCLCLGQTTFTEARLQSDLGAFSSAQWQGRELAFNDLVYNSRAKPEPINFAPADSVTYLMRIYPASSERLRLALVSLLLIENKLTSSGTPLPEEYTDYYGNLIMAVSVLRDIRSVEGLVGAVNTGGMAKGALSALGDQSLNATLAALKGSPDEETQMNLADVLAEMATPGRTASFKDPASAPKLKAALLDLAQSSEHPGVRKRAVVGLSQYSDQDVKSTLQQIAQSDPYSVSPAGKTLFPVRAAAQKALQK